MTTISHRQAIHRASWRIGDQRPRIAGCAVSVSDSPAMKLNGSLSSFRDLSTNQLASAGNSKCWFQDLFDCSAVGFWLLVIAVHLTVPRSHVNRCLSRYFWCQILPDVVPKSPFETSLPGERAHRLSLFKLLDWTGSTLFNNANRSPSLEPGRSPE